MSVIRLNPAFLLLALSAPFSSAVLAQDAALQGELDNLPVSGMAYADARQALLDAGWKPLPTENCKANVVGGNWQDICAIDAPPALCDAPRTGRVQRRRQVLSRFQNPNGEVILIHATGMLEDRNVAGGETCLSFIGREKAND